MTGDSPRTRHPRVPDEAIDYYVGIRRESVLSTLAVAEIVVRVFDLPHTPAQFMNVCRARGIPNMTSYAEYTPQMISDYEVLVSCRVQRKKAADMIRAKYDLPVTAETVYGYMLEHCDPAKCKPTHDYVLVVVEQTKMVAKRVETL